MALASLGFSNGPQVTFRINPSEINWGFDIHSNVENTVGGRVVQITGATLRDITVAGYFGEDRRAGSSPDRLADHAGSSWRLAEAFLAGCRAIMKYQSRDATAHRRMHEPAVFNYPPRGWRYQVYLKSVDEIDGSGAIEHRSGKFSHGYRLTLFIVQAGSTNLVKAGASFDEISEARAKAIASYIERISEGIGWKRSAYNGGLTEASTGGSQGREDE